MNPTLTRYPPASLSEQPQRRARTRSQGVAPRRHTLVSILLLLLATILFYWKILLTNQFSLLTGWETVTQAYSWLQFWTSNVRHAVLPLWDPYTLAGHSFAGEMQTAVFYPLHLLLAWARPGQGSVLSPAVYHGWIAFNHFLAACFMFALVRELGLSRFAAWLSGICFSLGGFVSRMQWLHMLESAIWLPLIFLFLLRALGPRSAGARYRNAALGGLMLGMSILAGGMHVVVMQVLAVAPAALFYATACNSGARGRAYLRPAAVLAVLLASGLAAGAVQLLPSIEYSHRAIRYFGKPAPLPASEKIPYDYLRDGLWPNSVVALLIPQAFGGSIGGGEVINPYFGVFPLVLSVIGIWKAWGRRWTPYLAGLALAALLYSWGSLSLLHGLLYAVVPRLWIAREAGRIVYLADFSLSILAGFGAEVILSKAFRDSGWRGIERVLRILAIAGAAVLFVPALLGRPEISPWISLSIVLIVLSYGLLHYIARAHRQTSARVLIVALVLFDLAAFDWTARDRLEIARTDVDYRDRLLSCRAAAHFLKAQIEPYRVEVGVDPKPNIGDLFGIPTTSAAGVTMPVDYSRIAGRAGLLNIRYLLMSASSARPGAVYQDATWKIYENPNACRRAWLVHQTIVESVPERALALLNDSGFDPRRMAVIDGGAPLDPSSPGVLETAVFSAPTPNRLEVRVHAGGRGLLVLSEMFYPGWHALVNAVPARIYRADAALRGVVVPAGDSRVVLEYRPLAVYLGAALTAVAFLGTFIAVCAARIRPQTAR